MVCSRAQDYVRGREETSNVERHEDKRMVWRSQGVHPYRQREKQSEKRYRSAATCVCLLQDLGYIAGEMLPGQVSGS